jgi:hypothetical protein
MTAGHVANSTSHREYGEAERQGDTQQADADVWKGSREDRATASSKYQPERADELGGRPFG